MGIQLRRNWGWGGGGGGRGHHMLCLRRCLPVPLRLCSKWSLWQPLRLPIPSPGVLGTISQKGGKHVKVGILVEWRPNCCSCIPLGPKYLGRKPGSISVCLLDVLNFWALENIVITLFELHSWQSLAKAKGFVCKRLSLQSQAPIQQHLGQESPIHGSRFAAPKPDPPHQFTSRRKRPFKEGSCGDETAQVTAEVQWDAIL